MGIFKAKNPCTKNTIFTTSNTLIYGGFMISLNDFYEQICRKRRDLAYHMSECEWAVDTDVLEEDHPEIRIELGRMREQFWSSENRYSCEVIFLRCTMGNKAPYSEWATGDKGRIH